MDTHLSSLIYNNWVDQTVSEFLGLIIICKSLFSLLKNFSFDVSLLLFVSLCSCHELIKVCVCRTWRTSWDKLEKWLLQMHIGPNLMKGEKIISICITHQLTFRNTSQGLKLWWYIPMSHCFPGLLNLHLTVIWKMLLKNCQERKWMAGKSNSLRQQRRGECCLNIHSAKTYYYDALSWRWTENREKAVNGDLFFRSRSRSRSDSSSRSRSRSHSRSRSRSRSPRRSRSPSKVRSRSRSRSHSHSRSHSPAGGASSPPTKSKESIKQPFKTSKSSTPASPLPAQRASRSPSTDSQR